MTSHCYCIIITSLLHNFSVCDVAMLMLFIILFVKASNPVTTGYDRLWLSLITVIVPFVVSVAIDTDNNVHWNRFKPVLVSNAYIKPPLFVGLIIPALSLGIDLPPFCTRWLQMRTGSQKALALFTLMSKSQLTLPLRKSMESYSMT